MAPNSSPIRSLYLALIFLHCITYTLAQPETTTPDIEISETPIQAASLTPTTIAIPPFQIIGQTKNITPATLPDIIYNDLETFSNFQRARNQQFVIETHQRDLRKGNTDTIDFAEWQRLGAEFVLKGTIQLLENGQIEAQCQLFDVTYGVRAFGYAYENQSLATTRNLAHQVSDHIVESVFPDTIPIAQTKILFIAPVETHRVKEVFLMDADGYNVRQLTKDKSLAATPCWGMNGTEIYYTSYKDVNPDLCGFQLRTEKTWFVSRRPGLNVSADWNQPIERIAITLGRDGNSEIYTMARSGHNRTLKRLTFHPGIDSSPSWNPAGNQIVFQSDRTGRPHIWKMESNGANATRLTRQGTYNDSPVWSPLGDKIAFVSRDQGRFDIYTMRIDGTDLRQITFGPASSEDPSWAPDGRHIIFSSNRSGQYNLYIVRSDGTNLVKLPGTGVRQSPAWSPQKP